MRRAGVLALVLIFGALCSVARAQPELQTITAYRSARPPSTRSCLKRFRIRCYRPAQLRRAYGLPSLLGHGIDGSGRTIVVIDSFGSPTLRRDLRAFDAAFGLPDPPSLRIYSPVGSVPRFSRRHPDMVGWAVETTLDVEWSHVFAPGASIVVLETPVDETEGDRGMPQMMNALRWALARHIGDLFSMSFGATEQTFKRQATIVKLRSALTAATSAGVGLVTATGDTGTAQQELDDRDFYPFPTTAWPASDPLVLAVGGTKLKLDAAGNRLARDVVWHDRRGASGGGLSTVFGRPSYQDPFAAVVGRHRGVPDISMSAALSAAEDVHVSFLGRAGWIPVGGTSVAAVEMAGLVADADQLAGHPIADLPAKVYATTSGIIDITKGNNGFGPFVNRDGRRYSVRGFRAMPGYDLASGLGTVDAASFVPALAQIG
jgi:subtilase family serine protease